MKQTTKLFLALGLCLLLACGAACAETYTATGKGMGGDVPVTVEYTDGKIVSVTVGENNETPGIGDKAIEALPDAIVSAQSADVDVVSGASVTSEAILSAVKDALAQAGVVTETEADAQPAGEESYPGETKVNEIFAEAEAKSQANAPVVKTLANGVQIQRTPDDVGGYWHRPGDYNSYNTFYLKADQRGCGACHDSLVDLLDNMSYDHLTFKNGYGMDMEVTDCLICHDDGDGYLYTCYDFGTLIHGIHSTKQFEAMNGNCWSCHNATADGNGMMLWDEAKYDVLQGITFISDVQGEFSFSQDVLSDMDTTNMGYWMSGKADNSMYGASAAGLPLDEDLFNNWEITVDGDVENPYTMTLPELIETFGSKSEIMTNQCVMNPIGGSWIATAEATGISISKMLEYAGVKDGATAVMSYASDGWNRGIYLSELEKDDALLAYELNGKRLDWAYGYPCSTWNGAGSAASFIRNVIELRVVSDEKIKTFDGWYYVADGTPYNIPNVGICHFLEGQIIEVGKPYTFEGYADAFAKRVVAVEFSLDRGQTWTRFETENTDRESWVYWYFTFTPELETSYVLSVRAIAEDGSVTSMPEEVLFNAR